MGFWGFGEAEAVNKSYTDFFSDLQQLGAKVDIE